jgi:hypothetical protein
LVVLAVAGARSDRGVIRGIAAISVLIAAILKLYPIFAVVLFLRGGRKARRLGYALCGAFLVYAAGTLHDLDLIDKGTPHSGAYSYGAAVGPRIGKVLGAYGQAAELWVVGLSVALGVVASLLIARSNRSTWPTNQVRTFRSDLFWTGAAIFLGTFLLGYNFEYRLIFLTLTVPQLLAWSASVRGEALLSRAALGTMIAYLWLKEIVVVELLDWGLFVGLLSILLLNRPRLMPGSKRRAKSPAALSS